MDFSGIAAYRRLRKIDPAVTQSIVRFAEWLAVTHNLEPSVATDVKQALCQFALDLATRQATSSVIQAQSEKCDVSRLT